MEPTIIGQEKCKIRFVNYQEFIAESIGSSTSKHAILVLGYNSSDNLERLLKYMFHEKYIHQYDIIIVDNSTSDSFKIDNKKLLAKYSGLNIIYLSTTINLGSAGGYSLGSERIINHRYEYLTIVEDDIILLDAGTFDDFLQLKKGELGFIHACDGSGGHSRYVQCACYPIEFIEQSGVIDPKFFFRGDDLEWIIRLEKTVKKYNYQKVIFDHQYLHPHLKKNNSSISRIYFVLRNWLVITFRHHTGLLYMIGIFYGYCLLGCILFFQFYSPGLIYASILALFDGLRFKQELHLSQKRLKFLNHFKIHIGGTPITSSIDHAKNTYKDYFHPIQFNTFSKLDHSRISGSPKLSRLFTKGVIIGGTIAIPYIYATLGKEIIAIQEFDLEGENVELLTIKNSMLKNMLILLFSVIIVTPLSIVAAILIISVYLYSLVDRKI